MNTTPLIPVLRQVIDASQIPVEVSIKNWPRIWHDASGTWLEVAEVLESDDRKIEELIAACSWKNEDTIILKHCSYSGVLRICDMIPISDRESGQDGFRITPHDQIDIQQEYEKTLSQLRTLARKQEQGTWTRIEEEAADRLSQRLYIIAENVPVG